MTRILNGLAPQGASIETIPYQSLPLTKQHPRQDYHRISFGAPDLLSHCTADDKSNIESRHNLHILSSRRTSHIKSNDSHWDKPKQPSCNSDNSSVCSDRNSEVPEELSQESGSEEDSSDDLSEEHKTSEPAAESEAETPLSDRDCLDQTEVLSQYPSERSEENFPSMQVKWLLYPDDESDDERISHQLESLEVKGKLEVILI